MRISDWSSDVCSSDLLCRPSAGRKHIRTFRRSGRPQVHARRLADADGRIDAADRLPADLPDRRMDRAAAAVHPALRPGPGPGRGMGRGCASGGGECAARLAGSEEHTSELQSLMSPSYAVFCLKKKKKKADTIYDQNT